MPISSARTAVTTSRAVVWPKSNAYQGGGSVLIRNTGSAEVDLGGSDVTTGNGFPLAAGESASFGFGSGEKIYAVGAAASTLALIGSVK